MLKTSLRKPVKKTFDKKFQLWYIEDVAGMLHHKRITESFIYVRNGPDVSTVNRKLTTIDEV